MTLLPPSALDQFARLRHCARAQCNLWRTAIHALLAHPRPSAQLLQAHAQTLNCTPGHLRKKLAHFKHGTPAYPPRDWRILVNHTTAGPAWRGADPELPEAFIEHLAATWGKNQRGKFRAQYRALLRQWHAWRRGDDSKRIPGYDTCPAPGDNGHHPPGWSYPNLLRAARSRPQARTELALATLGVAAALATLPPVPGTRAGLRPLEYVIFDDVYLDRKVIVPGYRQPLRMLQLGCLDYATGVYLKFGQQPELWNDDPDSLGTKTRLREKYTQWLIASLLEHYGYPADYQMHLILERGTATLRPADARALHDLTQGRVICHYTSMQGLLVLAWDERRIGNPRGKAPLESWHNLLHNESATLPGQMGKDRDHSPADLHGRERHALALGTASALLPPEERARLKLPFVDRDQCYLETLDIVARINTRTQHDLEDFDWVPLWRLKGVQMDWQPESALPMESGSPDGIGIGISLIEYARRKESPLERLGRLAAGLKFEKLPPGILARFYQDSHALERIRDYAFTFTRDGKTHRYTPPRPEDALPEGHEYLGYYNPWEPDWIHLTTKDGAYVTSWPREQKIRRGDQQALAESIAKKTRFLNQAIATLRRQRAPEIAQAEADLRHNHQVLSDAGLVPVPMSHPDSIGIPSGSGSGSGLQAAVNALSEAKQQAAQAAQRAADRLAAEPDDFRALDPGPVPKKPDPSYAISMDELNEL